MVKKDHFSLFGTSLYTGVSTVPYILSFQICRGSIVLPEIRIGFQKNLLNFAGSKYDSLFITGTLFQKFKYTALIMTLNIKWN